MAWTVTDLLFIQSSPYDAAMGVGQVAVAPVPVINAAPHVTVSESQGLVVVGEVHQHVTSGGIAEVSSGDRLLVETTVVTPYGAATYDLAAVVVDDQVLTVDDPNLELAKALFAAGLLGLDANGQTIVTFIAGNEPPPASTSDDAGIPISDNYVDYEAPATATEPEGGCETWQDVTYDPATGELVPALYHSTGPGTYEVFL